MSEKTYAIMIPPPPLEMLIWWWEAARRKARHNAPANVRRRARYISRAKYRPGRKVRSIGELSRLEAVYWNGRYTARGWFASWQIQYALRLIGRGELRLVTKRKNQSRKGK